MALPVFAFPIYNPDLFWHLSVGRWIVEQGRLPYFEFLSFSLPGREWLDFEWAAQVLFHGVFSAGGFAGLWLLKIALLAGIALCLDSALKRGALPAPARAGALIVWVVNAFAYSDVRPELFSLLFFTYLLSQLEGARLGAPPGAGFFVKVALLFAVWSNLHAGFPFGLVLLGIYAAGEAAAGRRRPAALIAAATALAGAAALANPYGAGPYRVAYEHWLARADLARYIQEWHPMRADNPLKWPFWATLGMTLAAIGARLAEPFKGEAAWRGAIPWGPILLCGHFGANALLHGRVAAFFSVAAALLLGTVAAQARGALRKIFLAALAAAVVFVAWVAPRLYWKSFFNDKFVPRGAAEFMARQEPVLAALRPFNQWEWGGYLAWRLAPWYRVWSDGRYIFHPQLPEVSKATESPQSWQEFMERRRLNAALVPNRDATLPSTRRYPDGSTKAFDRPWYVFYFPKERWALIYWDEKSLLFVERNAVPSSWLAAREYRFLKPRDAAAFQDAASRGEIPKDAVAAESRRHAEELAWIGREPAPRRRERFR